MNIHFITFGGGHTAYEAAGIRLCTQATESNWFKTINFFNIESLRTLDPPWFVKHVNFIQNNPRGFGYWIWKPKLILENLARLPANDILVYLDSGCEINALAYKVFTIYLDLANQSNFLAFYLPNEVTHCIQIWTKRYLLNYFKTKFKISIDESKSQIEGGIQIIKNNSETRMFFQQWAELIVEEDYRLVNDDNCSTIENLNFKFQIYDPFIL